MANYEATRYDFDGANLTGIEGIPTATIVPWSDSTVPTGFLECNGQAVSRSTYADLFAIVGTTYGSGDGSTTFNVPDLQDNVAIGKSGTKPLASTGGANTVEVTGNVAGSTANATLSESQLASHNHSFVMTCQPVQASPNAMCSANFASTNLHRDGRPVVICTFEQADRPLVQPKGGGTGHAHNMSANFAGDSNSVVQPYLTVIYIIKT